MQWGSKQRGSSVLQNISKGMKSLLKGCVNLFYLQVGRDKLSLPKLNRGILVYSQAGGQGPPGKPFSAIIIIKAMKSKSKKQFSAWSQNWFSPCNKMLTAAMKLKDTPWKKSYDQPGQHIKKQRHYFANKCPSSQGYGFSSSHVWM